MLNKLNFFSQSTRSKPWLLMPWLLASPGDQHPWYRLCRINVLLTSRVSVYWHGLTHWPLGDLNVILKNVIFNLALLIGIFKSSYDNVLRWMPQDLTDDKSTLVQVMAWCRQATSHYLNQCCPRSPTPYGFTRPQWVNFVLSMNK